MFSVVSDGDDLLGLSRTGVQGSGIRVALGDRFVKCPISVAADVPIDIMIGEMTSRRGFGSAALYRVR